MQNVYLWQLEILIWINEIKRLSAKRSVAHAIKTNQSEANNNSNHRVEDNML